MFIDDDDELFGGSPRKKYFDIIFNANRNLVEDELSRNLEKLAAYELLFEEMMGEDKDVMQIIQNYIWENPDKVKEKQTSLFIEGMGDILTKNE
ncbi:MAG: DUF2018 domain-containing protein [Sulfurospirillum sp.]|nr:MAG: DUF2018 domain-containing protein [Sulfurospirillum sp.]